MTDDDIDRLIDSIPSGMLLRPALHLFARAVEAHVRAVLSAPAVPEGWKLVPIEPTREMMAAAVRFANGDAVYKNVTAEALKIEEDIYGEVYEAMLNAAPQPQEPQT